jgi:large subunit ribosomal protein L28
MAAFERRLNSAFLRPGARRRLGFEPESLDAAPAVPLYGPLSRKGCPLRVLISCVRRVLPGDHLKDQTMSRRCELTGIGPMVGHSVSHSNVKTKRRFLPSLKKVKLASEALGQSFTLRISNAALRTLDFKGGLDAYIVKAGDEQLSLSAQRIKRQVKAKLAEQAAA